MSMDGATLYDLLLFRVLDRYGQDAHEDQDTEGDHIFLASIADPVFKLDQSFQAELEAIKGAVDSVPRDMNAETWRRSLNYRHLAAMMGALRRHGYLDRAPVPDSSVGEDFL